MCYNFSPDSEPDKLVVFYASSLDRFLLYLSSRDLLTASFLSNSVHKKCFIRFLCKDIKNKVSVPLIYCTWIWRIERHHKSFYALTERIRNRSGYCPMLIIYLFLQNVSRVYIWLHKKRLVFVCFFPTFVWFTRSINETIACSKESILQMILIIIIIIFFESFKEPNQHNLSEKPS